MIINCRKGPLAVPPESRSFEPDQFRNPKEILDAKGLRLTRQREAVISALAQTEKRHLSAEEIWQTVARGQKGIGLATVYRTLSLLESAGVITSAELGDGRSRYELCDRPGAHTHHHLICTRCGKVEEAEQDLLNQIEQYVESRHGFRIDDHVLRLYGLCSSCRGTPAG
jgi:Fur family ferric uptake transcriptional regulator